MLVALSEGVADSFSYHLTGRGQMVLGGVGRALPGRLRTSPVRALP